MTDLSKARRENMRWNLLNALNKARPIGAQDELLLTVIQSLYDDCTPKELHSELEYLKDRDLVIIDKQPSGHWHAKLNSNGVDVVDYTVHCPAGIARPSKYWN
ncbi:hypothetical protein I2F27_11435 [Acinetobacter sp. B5B]|uniref:hypothetical protein n=1 Tax=Acinetobacter baretiae TaxID=2605383 RepID=UPI0018C2F5BA|nr:hypothetical protein [Acinetobacter baretiae]MBF7683931.1 hypothetical protein [Acinetobacter baretiae]MBF7686436.1 hypothetical protein [Acinetobacter baretiae]